MKPSDAVQWNDLIQAIGEIIPHVLGYQQREMRDSICNLQRDVTWLTRRLHEFSQELPLKGRCPTCRQPIPKEEKP